MNLQRTPYEKTLVFIQQQLNKQRDNYRDGRKHQLFQWEDFRDWLTENYEKYLDEVAKKVTKLKEAK